MMPNITNHQGNANQNHNKISPPTCHNGYYQKDNKYQVLVECGGKGILCTVGGNVNWCSHYGKEYGVFK